MSEENREEYDAGFVEHQLPLSKRAASNGPALKPGEESTTHVEGNRGQDFFKAFLKAQSEILPTIEADADNFFHKKQDGTASTYTSLGHALKVIRPVLNKHGFVLTQGCLHVRAYGHQQSKKYMLPVHTTLTHAETGEYETHVAPMPISKWTAQEVGSAMTYGRRYSLLSALGIATADDDGQSASHSTDLEDGAEFDPADGIIDRINECETENDLTHWAERNKQGLDNLAPGSANKVRAAYREKLGELKKANGNGGKNA